MVVVRLKRNRLEELTGVGFDVIKEYLFSLKCEVSEEGDYVSVEVNPDRPDMFISEGVSRALRGILDIELGWRPLTVTDGSLTIVNESPASRPFIMGAVVRGVYVDEDLLVELMQFQEKLHDTIGRRRRKVAIGIHDLSKIDGRSLTYKMLPLDTKFVPLNASASMEIREVLKATEQGQKYGALSVVEGLHPAIVDERGDVISLPPVINSEKTKVEAGTRDLFIDVTGTDQSVVSKTLDVLVSTIIEGKRSAKIELVNVLSPKGAALKSPALQTRGLKLSYLEVNQVLGTDLTTHDIALSLLRMRYGLEGEDEETVSAVVPPFRVDVLSNIDLVEDVAIALGYESERLAPPKYSIDTSGNLLAITRLKRTSRELMVGLGFTELMSYLLAPSEVSELVEDADSVIRIKNPVVSYLDSVRPSVVASLLLALKDNVGAPKPVKVFEIGKAATKANGRPAEDERLAAAIMDYSVSFEDIQAVAYAYVRALGGAPSTRPAPVKYLIGGRSASLLVNGVEVGYVGELSPEILVKLGIDYPVAAFEVSLRKLLEVLAGGAAGRAT